MDARLSTLAEEIGVALLSLLFFGMTLFALAFVNV
jgi:hypothetical protein